MRHIKNGIITVSVEERKIFRQLALTILPRNLISVRKKLRNLLLKVSDTLQEAGGGGDNSSA